MRLRNRLPQLVVAMLLTAASLVFYKQAARADDLAAIRQRGTLIVGVKADYPPFGFHAPSGAIEGIEPSLAADVAKSLGVKLALVPVTAANRIEMLQAGKIDVIIATMNDTMGRRAEVDVIKPYYYAAGYNVMVAKALGLTSWGALKGKPVCGVKGAYYNYEAEKNFQVGVTEFDGPAEALAAMRQGRCVGMLYDDASIKGQMLDPAWSEYGMPLESQEVQPWGIAVRKDQPELAAYLSGVVKTWLKDGTILALETRYRIAHAKYAEDAHQRALASGD